MIAPHGLKSAVRLAAAAAGLAIATAGAAPAQEPPITGFSVPTSTRQRALETNVLERIRPATLDSIARALTREPHVAGSTAQARTRDWVTAYTSAAGLESEVSTYTVFLPWPTRVELELTAPEHRRFELREDVLPEDPASERQPYPWVNGYSGTGAAEAEVVYANYGLHEDYAALQRLGVGVAGRVVIARFGGSYRGIKARLAEQHGAAALLIYSDPADDGYVRGDVYPRGPYRHRSAAQRGSVMNGPGDPTTPGWPSVADVRRIEPGAAVGVELPSIPVIPISYGVAEPILEALAGADIPQQAWQGGLPFRYHVGPGPARVRLRVEDDRATDGFKEIWNTVAWLPGAERPDEWVIVGAHRDAWNAGATDNVSGTATVLAAARALAELAHAGGAGTRPRRTLAFATWDAEEWGLIGSTEWVEQRAAELGAKAVAYLNQDGVATGDAFSASASPSLKQFIRDISRAVPMPDRGEAAAAVAAASGESVYRRWRARVRANAGSAATAPAAADPMDVPLGNLGGGSDFAGFYNHLGIPSAGWGFGGGWGQYHSAYDTYHWMARIGDPGFLHHAAGARLVAVAALRLANADVLPFDYEEFARELRHVVLALARDAREARLGEAGLGALEAAFSRMAEAAAEFAAARDARLRADRPATAADAANRHLLRVERAMTRPDGLPGRPWYRNLIFAADDRNGYATIALPGIAEAVRAADAMRLRREAADLTARIDAATAHIRAAADALAPGAAPAGGRDGPEPARRPFR